MENDKDIEKMTKRIRVAVEKADLAFWAEIVKEFPEVKSGDFGPEETFAWRRAMEEALRTWLFWNHPNHEMMERFYDQKYRRV